ncbi:MAG: hypothetical protein WDO24_25260 [Pseudomonadota bacterium]
MWGALAFLLNYVPILGPLTGVVLFFLAGLITFTSPWLALIPRRRLSRHPYRGRRDDHADAAGAALHAQSGCW